jgi:alpha-L-rhamnosidase
MVERCHQRHAHIGEVWRRRHLRPDGTIESDTQSVYVCAWHAGLVPDDKKPLVASALRAAFARWQNRPRTGILGTAHLFDVLMAADLADVAWGLLADEEFPSYGHFLKNGATTIPEWWDPWPGEHETTEYWKAFSGDRSQNEFHGSLNHPVFCAIFEGIFKHVWGLRQAPGSAGFREVVIQPRFTDRLESFSGVYKSVAGIYKFTWIFKKEALKYSITVPGGCRAVVIPPNPEESPVRLASGTTSLSFRVCPPQKRHSTASFP